MSILSYDSPADHKVLFICLFFTFKMHGHHIYCKLHDFNHQIQPTAWAMLVADAVPAGATSGAVGPGRCAVATRDRDRARWS